MIANGIKIQNRRTGGDRPAVVISHGTTDDGIGWMRVARALEQDYDVIMYDRRGHGFSDASESGHCFEDHAVDLVELIAALDLAQPRVIGHSSGAAVAASAGASHPDLFAGVVLEDPAWGSAWGDWATVKEGMREWFLSLGSRTREDLIAQCRESKPVWTEEEFALWAEIKLQIHRHVAQAFDQPPLWQDWIRQITCPILLITDGPGKGAINTPQDLQLAASLWHEGRAVRIDGAGHLIHTDRPEPFMEAVKTFLAQVAAGEGVSS